MTDIQLVTITLTLLAILGSVYANRKSLEDMRDVLRAEAKAQAAESRGETYGKFAEIKATLVRLENKIDHSSEIVAGHDQKLGGK